jgi:hypothetical protein
MTLTRKDLIAIRLLRLSRGEGTLQDSMDYEAGLAMPLEELLKQKTCRCQRSHYRDPDCEREYPDICPWRSLDLAMLCGAPE